GDPAAGRHLVMTGNLSRLRLYVFACVVLTAGPAAAQAQDDLLTDAELHDVMLTLSDRDWSDLKAHPEENTNYTADLRWRGITVRKIGLRSRGTSTRHGVKPGLRLDMNRYVDQTFLGLRLLVLDNGYTDPSM